MNITEHEMRGLLAGKCLPGDMRVNEELPAYLVRKFAEAKAERDALAAENAVMKDYLKECSVVQGEGNWTSDAEKSVYVPAKDWMPLTPATDAYLNSVRAEAVTSFAHHQRVIADATPEHGCQRGRRFAAGLAEDFAAQLRAGEPS